MSLAARDRLVAAAGTHPRRMKENMAMFAFVVTAITSVCPTTVGAVDMTGRAAFVPSGFSRYGGVKICPSGWFFSLALQQQRRAWRQGPALSAGVSIMHDQRGGSKARVMSGVCPGGPLKHSSNRAGSQPSSPLCSTVWSTADLLSLSDTSCSLRTGCQPTPRPSMPGHTQNASQSCKAAAPARRR